MDYKQQFCEIFEENVRRDGARELLEWMGRTDFFTAPASTKYHCACEFGLVIHSLNVYNTLVSRFYSAAEDDLETFTVCGLLHDICKAEMYKISTRNVKNGQGRWEQVPYYTVEDKFPYGHGEKSVFLIERFMRLKPAEAVAIRWHMGGFDDAVKAGSFALSQAYEKYPLAVKLHLADLESTYLVEKGTSSVHKK